MTRWLRLRPLFTLACGVVIVSSALASQPASLVRTRLLQAPIPSTGAREAVMVHVELAPHSVAGKHYHHGIELGYVLSGTAVLEIEGKPPLTLNAGDSFQVDDAVPHDVSTRESKLTVLGLYLVEMGKPLAEPVK